MELGDLIKPNLESTLNRVRHSRSWRLICAIRRGVKTVQQLSIHMRLGEHVIRALIRKAGPVIWVGCNKDSLPGAGKLFYFINPDYAEILDRKPKPKPVRVVTPEPEVYAEPTEYELLRFPRLMQLNTLNKRGEIFEAMRIMTQARKIRIVDFSRRMWPRKRDSFSIGYRLLKLLLKEGFVLQPRPHFSIHPECLHCVRLIESEVHAIQRNEIGCSIL